MHQPFYAYSLCSLQPAPALVTSQPIVFFSHNKLAPATSRNTANRVYQSGTISMLALHIYLFIFKMYLGLHGSILQRQGPCMEDGGTRCGGYLIARLATSSERWHVRAANGMHGTRERMSAEASGAGYGGSSGEGWCGPRQHSPSPLPSLPLFVRLLDRLELSGGQDHHGRAMRRVAQPRQRGLLRGSIMSG